MILFVFYFCLPLTFRVLIWSRSYVIFIHSFIHSHFLHLLFASVSCMSWSFSTLSGGGLVLFCSMVMVMVMVVVVVVWNIFALRLQILSLHYYFFCCSINPWFCWLLACLSCHSHNNVSYSSFLCMSFVFLYF